MRTNLAFREEEPALGGNLAALSSKSLHRVDMRPTYVNQYSLTNATTFSIDQPHRLYRIELPESGNDDIAPFLQCVDVVNKLLSLPPNWDTYGARVPTEQAAHKAIDILSSLVARDAKMPAIVPTSTGGIQLEWHNSGFDVEIEITPDAAVSSFVDSTNYSNFWTGRQLPNDPGFLTALDTVSYSRGS